MMTLTSVGSKQSRNLATQNRYTAKSVSILPRLSQNSQSVERPTVSQEISKKINKRFRNVMPKPTGKAAESAYNAYRLDAIIKSHNTDLYAKKANSKIFK